jgi:hypothetical protein
LLGGASIVADGIKGYLQGGPYAVELLLFSKFAFGIYSPAAGVGVGAALGVALGAAVDHLALGLALGTAFGAAVDVVPRARQMNTKTPC